MDQKNEAFVNITVTCPICNTESQQRYVKSKAFQPIEVEDDMHVVSYKWKAPQFAHIRPNFYHIWHCPGCHFSEEKEVFRPDNPQQAQKMSGKLELIKDKILRIIKRPTSVLVQLGAYADLQNEPVSLQNALMAHLLAVYCQELLTPNVRDYGRFGRFYLRIAWLYREQATLDIANAVPPEGFKTWSDFLANIKNTWKELPLDEKTAMEYAVAAYQKDLEMGGGDQLNDIRREINVMFLLASLLSRNKNYDAALGYIRTIFTLSTGKRNSVRKMVESGTGKIPSQQLDQMKNMLGWLNNNVDRATSLAEEYNNQIYQIEFPEARTLVLAMQNPTVKDIAEALKAKGFHDITIRKIATLASKHALQSATAPGKETSDNKPQQQDLQSENSDDSVRFEKKENDGGLERLLQRIGTDV